MSATKAQSDVVSVRVGPQDDGTASTSQQSQQLPTFQSPCLFGGASSAIGAGVLGFFFGALPSLLRNRRLALWRVWVQDGWRSSLGLCLISGVYSWVHCLAQRIRLHEDGWNRGFAGCATGLVIGWNGGPVSALQSCAGLGLISYIVDFGGAAETPPAQAAELWPQAQPYNTHTYPHTKPHTSDHNSASTSQDITSMTIHHGVGSSDRDGGGGCMGGGLHGWPQHGAHIDACNVQASSAAHTVSAPRCNADAGTSQSVVCVDKGGPSWEQDTGSVCSHRDSIGSVGHGSSSGRMTCCSSGDRGPLGAHSAWLTAALRPGGRVGQAAAVSTAAAGAQLGRSAAAAAAIQLPPVMWLGHVLGQPEYFQ